MLNPNAKIFYPVGTKYALLLSPDQLREEDGGLQPPPPVEKGKQREIPLLRQFVERGIVVPESDVAKWDLRLGYEVIWDGRQIVSVSGFTDPEQSRNRLQFRRDIVNTNALAFATTEIPVWQIGDPSVNVFAALGARIGKGARGMIIGEASSGKSHLEQRLVRSLMLCAKENHVITAGNSFFITLMTERGEDANKTLKLIGLWEDVLDQFPGINRELYAAMTADESFVATQLAVARAHDAVARGMDVFLIIDSIHSLVTVLGEVFEGVGSFASSGVSTKAISYVKRNCLFAGQVDQKRGGGSLTLIMTSLYEGERTTSATVVKEMGYNTSTFIMGLRKEDALVARPWPDTTLTVAREWEGFLDPQQKALQTLLWDWLRPMSPQDKAAVLRRMFVHDPEGVAAVPVAFEKAAIEQFIAGDSKARTPDRRLRANQAVINAAAALASLPDQQQAHTVMTLLVNAWEGLSPAERVKRLIDVLDGAELSKLGALLQGLNLTGQTPLDRLLSAAQELRGQADVLEVVRRLLPIIGVDPKQLVVSIEGDPVEEMMKISDRLKGETNRGFGRAVAKQLVDAGYKPDEVYQRLSKGESPKKLLRERGITDK